MNGLAISERIESNSMVGCDVVSCHPAKQAQTANLSRVYFLSVCGGASAAVSLLSFIILIQL